MYNKVIIGFISEVAGGEKNNWLVFDIPVYESDKSGCGLRADSCVYSATDFH